MKAVDSLGPDGTGEVVFKELKQGGSASRAFQGEGGRGDSYREVTELKADGTCYSDRLITMTAEQSKTPRFLLEAHGFDASEWELVSARNNIWNVFAKGESGLDVSTLYSSKISVRPLVDVFTYEDFLEAIVKTEPVKVKAPKRGEMLLEIAPTDPHFGSSTLERYLGSLERICEMLDAQDWAEVLLWVGSDLFHCDNFKNTTSNGTLVSSVDWPVAWSEAEAFMSAILERALARSRKVTAKYIIGNHDESMSWAFCQMLAKKYPQVVFDLEIEERKVHLFGDVAVGLTHGDNNRTAKDLDRIFAAEFPEFRSAEIREVHAGHLHHEVTVDQYGTVTRRLSTRARTDKWHREEGFVGAVRRFMVFRWAKDGLCGVDYV